MNERITLGNSDLQIAPVALGCWPLAGMTSGIVPDETAIATIHACLEPEVGINHLDTAYMYGAAGESERLIGRAIRDRREEFIVATKGGLHIDLTTRNNRQIDSRPETLRRECEESLQRLQTDRVEIYYLHAPDPDIPIEESAGAIGELIEQGKARFAGASNLSLDQLARFHAVCPIVVFQPMYNMLQRGIEKDILPWCKEQGISVLVYWPLLKGLLAGRLRREDVIPPTDTRSRYPMFHGEQWQKNHDLIDRLRDIAADAGKTVAQLVINWTIHRDGITGAICGAKRPEQIRDTAGAMGWRLSDDQLAAIDSALADRGEPESEPPV
ncbi:MAG: aldo/keto reductase [Planctomycetia bacterium]|jgi:aryl-alcohol dehydrogenase-like predicted oxidoreductase